MDFLSKLMKLNMLRRNQEESDNDSFTPRAVSECGNNNDMLLLVGVSTIMVSAYTCQIIITWSSFPFLI